MFPKVQNIAQSGHTDSLSLLERIDSIGGQQFDRLKEGSHCLLQLVTDSCVSADKQEFFFHCIDTVHFGIGSSVNEPQNQNIYFDHLKSHLDELQSAANSSMNLN